MSASVGPQGVGVVASSGTRTWKRVFYVVAGLSVGLITLVGAAFFLAVDAEGGY